MHKKTILGREFNFGIGFLNELLDGTGITLDELGKQSEAFLIPKITYYALLYSYLRESKEVDFSMYDINDMIDENGGIGGEFWNTVKVAFNDSMTKNVPVSEGKKKVTKKT